MKNYIFGYGSLMERESRLRSTPNAINAFPVEIIGFVRGWWARNGVYGFSTTFLGCIAIDDKIKTNFNSTKVNGVIYEVNEKEMEVTDLREKSYKRKLIKHEAINDYSGLLEFDADVWIYLNEFDSLESLEKNLPTPNFPIVQSYVDICINGCLEIEELFPLAKNDGFAVNFIKSTQCWNTNWANDRIYPRRPFIYCPNAFKIDELLSINLDNKTIFDKIYIE